MPGHYIFTSDSTFWVVFFFSDDGVQLYSGKSNYWVHRSPEAHFLSAANGVNKLYWQEQKTPV